MTNKYHEPLRIFVADCYTLLSQAQGFHWNITGPDFFDLHDFFQKIYQDLFESVDEFAERLRALQETAPYDLFELAKITTIPALNQKNTITGVDAVCIYKEHSIKLIDSAKKLSKLCEECGDLTTQDMLLDFVQEQEKFLWMARSFLGE